jgi:hypothetical protein
VASVAIAMWPCPGISIGGIVTPPPLSRIRLQARSMSSVMK